MSGHNKWSTIKHKKGAADAKRGKLFSRLIKEITIAARMGGGDADGNPRLRSALNAAKAANMPKDNMERAVKKGTGELEGSAYEEFNYEGYTPGGAAVLVEVLTDNKNRAASEVRHVFSKHGGNLGESGCVAWMFNKRGLITFDPEEVTEDVIMEIALEAGAEDVSSDESEIEVVTALEDFEAVKAAFEEKGLKYSEAEISMIPQTTVELDAKTATQTMKLMDALDDLEDVQKVWSNFDIPDEVMQSL